MTNFYYRQGWIMGICVLLVAFSLKAAGSQHTPVPLSWLGDSTPAQTVGVSWGVPWPQGTVKKTQSFTLLTANGQSLPLQTWPLAYWPDGSLKWSGFATVAGPDAKGALQLIAGKTKAGSGKGIQLKETARALYITTGRSSYVIAKSGNFLIDSLKIDGRLVASQGKLTCILQNGPDGEADESPSRENFTSKITQTTVEQSGPVRAVVRVQGLHQADRNQRTWLPFDVRLYFYAGVDKVRLVHTFVFDGNEHQDFIKGLGVSFTVPMREELHNRHVRFGGEQTGIWAEPIRVLTGRRVLSLHEKNVYEDQVVGKRVPNRSEFDEKGKALIDDWAVWSDYKLMQNTADGFTIQKRTNAKSAWLDATGGKRASGLAFVGDVSGGLSVGLKNFWQSYPAALDIRKAASKAAELKIWLWSPYGEAMDMRHYDTTAHGLEASYEDVQPGFSTAHGVARTSELTLFLSAEVPSNEVLSQQAALSSQPVLLVCTPEYLHKVAAFGTWSLPDRSKPGKRWIEEQLDKALAFYQLEVEQRHWYGFWDYGDVMHAYDRTRHAWRYDIGGFAWANSELAPDMWLWYSFLRTGRPDVFRMAEAMTRHTGEVDVYHLGRFAGLGSRHNVSHWGCGSKEVRISQAPYRRFYYYLTTDERTGDLMREVAHADTALVKTDPLRLILPPSQYPTHARIGPDWLALVGNWLTEWERTGDKHWRDKILAGVTSFAKMPYGFFSGKEGAFGYDPGNNKLYSLGEDHLGASHLTTIMGGAEVAFELSHSLNSPEWNKLWLQYCEYYGSSPEGIQKEFGQKAELGDPGAHFSRLPAYAAKVKKDPLLAERAWKDFLGNNGRNSATPFNARPVDGPQVAKPIQEVPNISTNNTAQWCLNAIELLELVGDQMPEHNPLWEK